MRRSEHSYVSKRVTTLGVTCDTDVSLLLALQKYLVLQVDHVKILAKSVQWMHVT